MNVQNFNLRVYGLLIHENRVLITHENRAGLAMTKFPGGGLEKGEGLADGLKREFLEELNLTIEIQDFFYVNDFLQISSFNKKDQLLSFYYFVNTATDSLRTINATANNRLVAEGEQSFEWIRMNDLIVTDFTFPIDQVVAGKLKLLEF